MIMSHLNKKICFKLSFISFERNIGQMYYLVKICKMHHVDSPYILDRSYSGTINAMVREEEVSKKFLYIYLFISNANF